MASKIVLLLGICVFSFFLVSPVTVTEVGDAIENSKKLSVTEVGDAIENSKKLSGPVEPPVSDHYVLGCKRCCYLDERGCISCCAKGDFAPTTAGRKEKAAIVAIDGHK